MQFLPSAFNAMAAYRQWMIYKLVPSKTKPGKFDKLPCHPVTTKVVTAHDPANWTTADAAIQSAASMGEKYGVAFVLTQNDPFFFLDIDSCLKDDGQWSDLAMTFLTYFQGCAVEISASGKGLHIIGSGASLPHGSRNIPSALEFYTQERFIALTGTAAFGDAGFFPVQQNLDWLVGTYFPKGISDEGDGELSDGPVPEWRGPGDDDELIRRALRSVSSHAALSGRATFADLWGRNVDALARTWPPDSDASEYNASSVDSALASHLAFWTGKDGHRIKRLMMQSALVREKWDREATYLNPTISNACASTSKVLIDKQAEIPPLNLSPDQDVATLPTATPRNGAEVLSAEAQVEFFKGCVYVRSLHKVWTPGGELLRPESFAVAFGGVGFSMAKDNSKISFSAWEAFAQSRVLRHEQVATTCFRPKLAPGTVVNDNGRMSVNTYLPADVPMIDGDPSIFLLHVSKLIPDARDQKIVLSYLAALVQFKGHKFDWAIVLQGVEGNGKTFFSLCAQFAVGKMYTQWPQANEISNKFNAWLFGSLLYCVEDILVSKGKTEIMEVLKPMITGQSIQIEGKGIDQITKDVCGNFIFNSNHKSGLRKSRNDRRLAMFFNPQQEFEDLARDGITEAYTARLYDWARGEGEYSNMGENYGFKVVAHFLSTYPIDPEFNPTGRSRRAPKTSSTQDAIEAGLGAAEQYVLEAIEEGRAGFKGGYVSSTYLARLLENLGLSYAPVSRNRLMQNIDYVPHPGLFKGRVNNSVMPDGAKPTLYVSQHNAALCEMTSQIDIARHYTTSQEAA